MATRERKTATFEPYFWHAYSEIVQPHSFDWYLVTRWLPDLGPEGFAVVKVLRNQCYFNPSTGALRDTCQISMDELADMVGMKRTSLYRLFDNNTALAAFVQKQPDVVFVEGRTRRLPPRFRVCMDTPIHPADVERYHQLQLEKHEDEADRRKSQYEIYEKRKSQKEGRKSQNQDRKSQFGISSSGSSLPSDSLLKESTPSAAPCPAPIERGSGRGGPTDARVRHGMHSTKLYHIWSGMRSRCEDPNHASYKNYGGRGIQVFHAWKDAAAFIAWALTNGYEEGLSIERRNVDGDYEPDNCHWVPFSEQRLNRRDSLTWTAWGETKPAGDWYRDARCSVAPKTVRDRVVNGWTIEDALSTPARSIDRPENQRGLALVRETLKRKQSMAAPQDPAPEREQVREEIAASLGQGEQ